MDNQHDLIVEYHQLRAQLARVRGERDRLFEAVTRQFCANPRGPYDSSLSRDRSAVIPRMLSIWIDQPIYIHPDVAAALAEHDRRADPERKIDA